jgi:hypothetical protein
MKGADVAALNAATEEASKKKKAPGGSKRHRMTEKEEDEELLNRDTGETDTALTVFTTSPSCKFLLL